jgi:fermentation-respiration switch protein FrsA (DUF1100 family)
MRRLATAITALLLLPSVAGCGDAGGRTQPTGTLTSDNPPDGAATTPPAAKRAPAEPYAVGVRSVKLNRGGDRPLPVTVWYPADGQSGGRPRSGVDAARGRFPVVLFSHGLTGTPVDYQPLLTRWAAAGFVVAAPAYPNTRRGAARIDVLDVLNQPADASYVLTEVLALDTRRGDVLRGRLDTARVGAAGHSAGGVTTLGLFTSGRDTRLAMGIVLAGSSLGVGTNFTGAAAPLLFVHGGRDQVVSYASGKAAYDAVPWPKAMLTLPNGDHGRSLQQDSDPSFRVIANTTVEFLRWSLYGDPTAKRRLAKDAKAGGLGTLDDAL